MTELQVDEHTAQLVRDEARRAGISEADWLAVHVRDAALRASVEAHGRWYAERPGLVEAEVANGQLANELADNP